LEAKKISWVLGFDRSMQRVKAKREIYLCFKIKKQMEHFPFILS